MFLRLAQCWILFCSGLSFAGWFLSYFGQLNRAGYAIFFLAYTALVYLFSRSLGLPSANWKSDLLKLRHRFKRLAPLLFLAMLLLSALGGVLYEPIHGDSQSYRVPRVLHWLWENRWHWIHTGDVRTNVTAPGCDWLWAPGFFIFPGQHWLFYYNSISLLLLPGLFFAFFRELGVRSRIAWWWMWILPAAYSYALQAGGISTDAFATDYALAAIVFAMRARRTRNPADLVISLVSAALMTGAKQTNLLLMPLWFLPFVVNCKPLLRRPALAVASVMLAIGASCLPISYLNAKYAGNWQGFTDTRTFVPHSPLYGILGNTLAIPAQNLLPPVFPLGDRWNAAMHKFRETPFGQKFDGFEDFGHLYRMPSDVTGGLGFVLCLLLLWTIVRGQSRNRPIPHSISDKLLDLSFRFGPWLLLIIFMAKVGTATNARYLSPVYPFLLVPFLLRSGADYRSRGWRTLAYLASVVVIFLLISSRQRPLFPVNTLCELGQKIAPQLGALQKVKNAYAYFQEHSQSMHLLSVSIPKNEKAVGYAAEVGFFESALWLPFGTRRVYRLTGEDDRTSIKSKGIKYIVLEETVLRTSGAQTIDNWLKTFQAKLILSFPLRRLGPEAPLETVYLVEL